MRKAEAEVMREHEMEVSLLVKSFFEAPVEAVLQRMAGAGGRRPSVTEAPRGGQAAAAAAEDGAVEGGGGEGGDGGGGGGAAQPGVGCRAARGDAGTERRDGATAGAP